MKHLFFTALAMIVLLTITTGCIQDRKDLFAKADILYLDVKTIVTDPEVQPLISENTMARLARAERIYLQASALARVASAEDDKPLKLLASCADEILAVITEETFNGKYARQVAAIRMTIKVLKNHIQYS